VSIASNTVALFRDEWSRRFVDTCVVDREDRSSPTFNEGTGKTEYPSSQVYSGACLIRPASAREIEFGESLRQQVDYDLYLPHDSTPIKEGDQVTVTSTLDSEIPVLIVLRGFTDSYVTKRHYECEVVVDD